LSDKLENIIEIIKEGIKITETFCYEIEFYGDWGDSPEEVTEKSGGKVELFPDNTVNNTYEGIHLFYHKAKDMTYSGFYMPGVGDIETIYSYTFDGNTGLVEIQISFSYFYGDSGRYENGRKITEQLPDALGPIGNRGLMKTYEPNFIDESDYELLYKIWFMKLKMLYGEPVLDTQSPEYDFDDQYVFTSGGNEYILDWIKVVQPYVYITKDN
jgi:hypothetical protein